MLPPVEAVPGNIVISLPPNPQNLARSINFRKLPFGSILNSGPISTDRHDVKTQAAALTKRLCRITPPVNQFLLAQFETHVLTWLNNNMHPLTQILTFEEWLESTDYTLNRKEALRKINVILHGCAPTEYQCQHVDSFIKGEFYELFKAARWINSRSDYFKAYSGRYFKSIEHELYKRKEFIKNVPVCDRPALIAALRKTTRSYVGTDFSSFEAHFTPEFMKACECQLYNYMLSKVDPTAAHTLSDTISGLNKLRTRQGVKVKLSGRRMSGDMCTSLGNGFSNLMVWDFLYSRRNVNGHYEGYVEGDDGIFSFTGTAPSDNDYLLLGFTIKITPVQDPTLASFCGIISADGNNLRDPRKWLQGFGWTQQFLYAGDKVMHELLHSKSLSAIYESPQCPIIGAVARRGLTLSCGYKRRDILDGFHKTPLDFQIPDYNPSALTRKIFQDMYGVSVALQQQIEATVLSGTDDELTCLLSLTTKESSAYRSMYTLYG